MRVAATKKGGAGMIDSRGVAKPTRFIGAYVEVFADHLLALVGGSDGANAVATAASTARHK